MTDGGDELVRLLMPTNAASARAAARSRRRRHRHDRAASQGFARIKLAGVQPDGTDRIRIFLPSMMEPEQVTGIFATKGKAKQRLSKQSAGMKANSDFLWSRRITENHQKRLDLLLMEGAALIDQYKFLKEIFGVNLDSYLVRNHAPITEQLFEENNCSPEGRPAAEMNLQKMPLSVD